MLDPLDPFAPSMHGRPLPRRQFLAGALAGSLGLRLLKQGPAAAADNLLCCSAEDPIAAIRGERFDALAAFFEAQLCSLFDGAPGDDAAAVANDALDFLSHLPRGMQAAMCNGLAWLNVYSIVHTRQPFAQLTVDERYSLLNQGESPAVGSYRRRQLPRILWDVDFPLHTAVSTLALLGRLIINSRQPAQNLIGFQWSAPCRDPGNLVHMAAPAYPDLTEEYDVCVVGSGAGGAVIAARAAEAGKRVLVIETGKWVSPDALVERQRDAAGREELAPARCDRVLKELYKQAGVQLTGGLKNIGAGRLDLLLESRRRQIAPRQSMIVLQAQVVGGGPYVNNAIHLEIEEEVFNGWPCRPAGVAYADLNQRMQEIKQQLGANTIATRRGAGVRGLKFAEGAARAGDQAFFTPVSILDDCNGCGADNSVDPFGMHTGGLHPLRPGGPNSYLMRALSAKTPAQIAYETRAVRFQFETDAKSGEVAVQQLVIEDRRGCRGEAGGVHRVVRAKQFTLCAGVSASTALLHASLSQNGLSVRGLGDGLNGNVGVPVFAIYDQPVYDGETDRPEPGITQCFFARERTVRDPDGTVHEEPVLENWFHFPGTVALALSGWFHEFGSTMRKYNHMAIAGMVVPTAVRPENRVQPDGGLDLELNDREFELLLRGILRIGRIFLAAATPDNGVTLHLPTKGVMLDTRGEPFVIRDEEQLQQGIEAIRARGPAYLNLLTSHPQGGNALGTVVDPATFRLLLADGRQVQNLRLADASIFPAGCEMNPQLTVMALAGFAADAMLGGRVEVAGTG